MPLCSVEVEQAAEDDLDELSEIEKRNLGRVLAYFCTQYLASPVLISSHFFLGIRNSDDYFFTYADHPNGFYDRCG